MVNYTLDKMAVLSFERSGQKFYRDVQQGMLSTGQPFKLIGLVFRD